MSRTPQQIVRDFAALWEAKDIEGAIAAMTEDCIYANMPIPAMHGHDEVRKFITPMMSRVDVIEWKFLAEATGADGKTVFTERVDSFVFGDKRVDCPLMGIFVLRGDKIHEWRDYADIGTFVKDMAAIGQASGVTAAAKG
jgi:limonene-1,2-epoxide hydrolase